MNEPQIEQPEEVMKSPATQMLEHHVNLHYPGFFTGISKGMELSPFSRIFSIAMGELFGGNGEKAMSEMLYAGFTKVLVH